MKRYAVRMSLTQLFGEILKSRLLFLSKEYQSAP
jgi:hypothetical protein